MNKLNDAIEAAKAKIRVQLKDAPCRVISTNPKFLELLEIEAQLVGAANFVVLGNYLEPHPSWMPTCGTEAEVWAQTNGQFSNGRMRRNG